MTANDTLTALLLDVDRTLAETERDGHRVAFNRAFEAFGLGWRWSVARYGELLAITGGRERLLADLPAHADAPSDPGERGRLARAVHERKNRFYAELVAAGEIALRPGVEALLDECRERGVRLGVATTTSAVNVEALLRAHLGAAWRQRFAAVVCGDDVRAKKPDPEVYEIALQRLGLAPWHCLAIEDAPAGVLAARAANVAVIVTRSVYFAPVAVDDGGVVAIGPGLERREGWQPPPLHRPDRNRISLDDLIAWHRATSSRASSPGARSERD